MKKINNTNAISILLRLSKVSNQYYAAIDAKTTDLRDFGISTEQFAQLGDAVESVVRQLLGEKIRSPESKL